MIEGLNVVVVIPAEYVRPSESQEDCMVLDMPATYAKGLMRLIDMAVDDVELRIMDELFDKKHLG